MILAVIFAAIGFALFYRVVYKYDISLVDILCTTAGYIMINLAYIEWIHR